MSTERMRASSIDLRSDTLTRPTPSMRRAMAAAEVGDDVYGEDPTVNRLEREVADRLGFEAALWVPSGTMGNIVGLRLVAASGDEVLVEQRSHVVRYELCGMAVLSGIMPRTAWCEAGRLTPEDVEGCLAPRAYYKSDVTAVVLENTHNLAGGTVTSVGDTRELIAACREAGLRIHIDGARIWNAALALGVEPRALVDGADTVMVAFSKGLCAPAGSAILASRERIEQARRIRKQLGGGMRQVGVLAAAALVGLEEVLPRLGDDHDNARLLGEALERCPGVRVAPVQTNIVVAHLEDREAPAVVSALAEYGVLAAAMDGATLRLVTHNDISRTDCQRAAEALLTELG